MTLEKFDELQDQMEKQYLESRRLEECNAKKSQKNKKRQKI